MSKQHSSRFLDLKPPPLDPKLAAQSGPIDLKEPGSEEWTIQLTARAVRIWMSLNDDTKAWRDAVAKLDAQQVWRTYPKEKPYGTRDAYYRAEMGAPEPELTLLKEVQQLQKHGTNQHTRGDSITTSSPGRGSTYIRARLQRDSCREDLPEPKRKQAVELLSQVERGEISAHKAAVQADYRQRMIQHAPTVPGFLHAAHSHLSPEQRLELKEAL
jgi:hypothetical protein